MLSALRMTDGAATVPDPGAPTRANEYSYGSA